MRKTDLKRGSQTPLLEISLTTYRTDKKRRRIKWYQRPMYRWTYVRLALLACVLIATQIALVAQRPAPPSKAALQIACNFLSIPDLKKCPTRVEFEPWNNDGDRINGSKIPTEIGVLTQLTYLDVTYNSLTGTILSAIGKLTQLTELYFHYNKLTGTIPTEIGKLTQLMSLYFYNNLLTGAIPSEIGKLTRLRGLSFSNNSLTGTIPSEIGELTQLRGLSFSINSMTGAIPSEIGELTQLYRLDFGFNDLSGTIPSSLSSLTSIDIYIDCAGKIACASGCCLSGETRVSCG